MEIGNMNKTFTIVGKSTLGNQAPKYRVANGAIKARTAVLARNGHTDISFIELPEAMSKGDALQFFEAQELMTPKFEDVSADILAREDELEIEVELEDDSEMDFNNTASPIHY